ncbi:hypothetical protein FOL47_002136 [Perkinsus chesapeaki]|uniref:Uncharacterized protein n=1 Tax=Perkinsus chesapeaki TaxID=330153 RepID=A0A7J6MFI3_PERCH|nr:hypothetical protein FOL47_002136 [Perkinsus chesapeaki]
MSSAHSSVSNSQGHTEESPSGGDSETDPLLDLDEALSRYLQRYGYYKLQRRDSGEVDEDSNGPRRQQSAMLMLGNMKSSDELSVKSRSAPPSRGQQRRGAHSQEKRALGTLTDAEYETFLADLREEANELLAARAEAAAKKPDDDNSDDGGTLSDFWDSSKGSQQSGSSLYDPAAEAAKEYKVEELDITLVRKAGQLHWSDEDNCGLDLDWASDPLTVEEVEEGSTGQECGLRNGDEIMRCALDGGSRWDEKYVNGNLFRILVEQGLSLTVFYKGAELQLQDLSDFQHLIEELRGILPSQTLVDATASISGLHREFEENVLAEIQRIKVESSKAKTTTPVAAENTSEEKNWKKTETVVMPGGGSAKVRKGRIVVHKKDLEEALKSSRLIDSAAHPSSSLSCSYEPPLITDV